MKFSALHIDESLTKAVGLKEINLNNLSSLVALIGKNGSGKTRILNLIESNFTNLIILDRFEDQSILEPPNFVSKIMNDNDLISDYADKKRKFTEMELSNRKYPSIKNNLEKEKKLVDEFKKEQNKIVSLKSPLTSKDLITHPERHAATMRADFSKNTNSIKQNFFKRINHSEITSLQQAIPLEKDISITFENLVESIGENIDYNEIGIIYKSSLNFLKKLPHQLVYDFNEVQGNIEKLEKRASYCRYLKLKLILKRFLDKDLGWEKRVISQQLSENGIQSMHEGYWTLNERLFDYNEFSDGEKSLFAYALLFFLLDINPNVRVKESIIFIDEPELHLHPDAEVTLIDSIREMIGNKGQLWIATHSINILSNLSFDEIHTVIDGKISNSSSNSLEQSLSQLIRLEDRVVKLSNFITSISDWTFLNFMTECFTAPEVIEVTNKYDPQIELFLGSLRNINKNQKLLLDFGAGKGRLLKSLQNSDFSTRIEYSALEPDEKLHPFLLKTGVCDVLSSYTEIKESSYDFIILCNVLHEIKFDQLIETLNQIIRGLRKNGHLMIIEASILSKGECVGDVGYLLFSPSELKVLFDLNETPNSFNKITNSNNIQCTIITKDNLKEISTYNLENALKELEKNTFVKIEKIRNNGEKINLAVKGRNTAFLSQLYINSKIAQKRLKQIRITVN
jgi:energy-coupling factor transporter ATP-binding protein EcfA2